ncbi:T0125640 isoform 1 [Pan troglodytes]|uniref:T0125640 isoform 1 n=1 Tax=Pan troglodytes TaxID=9598 RepID=A0A2J8KU57_PANTR|nr:T0125640 isoform 1 [Pan troglodytes]
MVWNKESWRSCCSRSCKIENLIIGTAPIRPSSCSEDLFLCSQRRTGHGRSWDFPPFDPWHLHQNLAWDSFLR